MQPLVATLPMSLLIYFIGKKRAGWVPGEFLLSFMPWSVAMLFTALNGQTRYLGDVIVAGIIGGFVLLPRLFSIPETPIGKYVESLKSAIVMTFFAVFVVLFSPLLLYVSF